ncbi:abortive infection AbiH-like protein [Dysgonomonas alginatilytica]|uniref:Abortive infection AbiH-like protein n=1 Tax=Dysgonomonas alginatilytica TaxID=1605892 RepID=A0A2V3PUX9_9BACT|nr:AbiH family protein [Dysgonomonas alginatilytica]PXV63328.1 abortive infection AbiH-like protein [Dysgonomonas alginatilytica]
MNNLIIIGNGFDLAHGLRTSYNHFIEHMVNSHCKDRECYKDLFKLPNYISNYSILKDEILAPFSSLDTYLMTKIIGITTILITIPA